MSKRYIVKRGFVPEELGIRNTGWLRVAEHTEGEVPSYIFSPFARVDLTVDSVGYDDTEKQTDYNGSTFGETKVNFTGQIALEGAIQEVEGFYYRSGHLEGVMRIVDVGQ